MSHIARLYIDQSLTPQTHVALDDDKSRYLLRVMRLENGARVRAFNASDGEWACSLRIEGKKAALVPMAQTRAPEPPAPALTLLFAPIRRNQTELIIEKATELGVSAIQPVITDFTQNPRLRIDRLHLIAVEAAEQSERLDLPAISEPMRLRKIIAEWDPSLPLVYCDEGGEAAPLARQSDKLADRACAILIGPEGGFSSQERELLRGLDFVIPITMGPRILRAETAAICALTLWQSTFGDWTKAPYLAQS